MRTPICCYVAPDGTEIVLCSDGSAWAYNLTIDKDKVELAWVWEEERPLPGSVRDAELNGAAVAVPAKAAPAKVPDVKKSVAKVPKKKAKR